MLHPNGFSSIYHVHVHTPASLTLMSDGVQWGGGPPLLGGGGAALVNEPLPLPIHGHLDVLQLVVPAYLQGGEHCQTHPCREGCPGTELCCANLYIES